VNFLAGPRRPRALGLVACLLALGSGCGDAVPIDANLGPFTYEVDLARISLPEGWRAGASLPGLACSPSMACPSLGPGAPAVRCTTNLCDPDPFTFDLSAPNVIDLASAVPGLDALSGSVDRVQITSLRYAVGGPAVSVPIGPVELYWGPESASGISSDGVHLVARIPVLRVESSGAVNGSVAPIGPGAEALSVHLTRTSTRFRLFARAAVDLAPRGPLPAGRASVSVQLSVRVTGQLLP